MSDSTTIEWTDATFNPWWGCVEVSRECDHCYAKVLSERWSKDTIWGKHAPRKPASEAYWRKPFTSYRRRADELERPLRVFCASMADVFETHPQLPPLRERLFQVIEETPWIHWQILTKRPRSVALMVPWGGDWPENVWIGTSVGVREHLWRLDVLRVLPATVRFVSAEPLLESLLPIDLTNIDWLIAGGESGHGFRPMHADWVRELRDACLAREIGTWDSPLERPAFFFKQWGGRVPKAGGKELDGREWCEYPLEMVAA